MAAGIGALLLIVGDLSATVSINAEGWTVITPSADSRLVYVSSSEGDDSNDGLSPETAKATIDGGNALIRNSRPDWLLLKRGDVFSQPALYRWKSGRNADEPLVMTYYGDSGPRPVILVTGSLVNWDGDTRNHTAFIGLDLYRSISDPESPDFNNSSSGTALRFVSLSADTYNLWVEDCRFRFCNPLVQGEGKNRFIHNFNFRRNVVANNWAHGSTEGGPSAQGMFMHGIVDYVFEENIFHHNGWSEFFADAAPNLYNHNLYIQNTCDGSQLVRGNIISFGAANGVQLRSGGTAVLNAFVGNAIGMNLGYYEVPIFYTGDTLAQDNVFTDGRPQIPNDGSHPQSGAIWGLWKQSVENTTVVGNIVANVMDDRGSSVLPYQGMTANELGTGNIAWNWVRNDEPVLNPGWPDPTRNADGFANTLGYADWNAYIDGAMNRAVGEMPYSLSAYAYVDYIREGFGKASVSTPYTLAGGCEGHPVEEVFLNVSELEMSLLGTSTPLQATLLPADACDRDMSWASDNEAVATVDNYGVVTSVSKGTAIITVTTRDGGFTDSVTVTVTGPVAVTGLSITQTDFSMTMGSYATLTTSILPANASIKTVIWSSDNLSVANVDADGEVVALSEGQATITARSEDGDFTDTVTITVEPLSGDLLISYPGFTPADEALLGISGGTYDLGTEATHVWWARLGTSGQGSSLVDKGDGDYYLAAGYGTTNGTFQAIDWPGEGAFRVDFIYRDWTLTPTIALLGGNSGDTINKFDNVHTLDTLFSQSLASSSEWALTSISVDLEGAYEFLVIQFLAGRFDNVFVRFTPAPLPAVIRISRQSADEVLVSVEAQGAFKAHLESSSNLSTWTVVSAVDLSSGETHSEMLDIPAGGEARFFRLVRL